MNTQIAYETMRSWFNKPTHGPGFSSDLGECAYRGEDSNHKCAIGAILPDKLYNDSMESNGIEGLVERFKSIARFFENTDINFLKRCQRLHDDTFYDTTEFEYDEARTVFINEDRFRASFIIGLDAIARDYGLNLVTT